ncbi:MAG: hypothetical protein RLZZ450_7453 [Pseudomonadota bacterium]|jgi:uncharacterized membrane protein YbhN (UPF0104 family)
MESQPPKPPRSRARIALGIFARLAITGLVFGFLFTRIDASAVAGAVERIPLLTLLAALASLLFSMGTGVVRWRALLVAYGAVSIPPWKESIRLYWVAMFYNLLPGAVGGDVYRGYSTRHFFADGAAARSVSVVFVERVFGFAGLLMLAAAATVVSPAADRQVLFYSGIGLCAAFGAVVTITIGRRVASYLPGPLAKLAGSLPSIERFGPFVFAIALSVMTHVVISYAGHVLIHSLAPSVTFNDSMSIFPIGTLAAYFPLTVAGAGARDTALVVLFAKLGVARENALATSLCLLACNLLVSGFGGLLQSSGGARAPLPSTSSQPGR